MAIWSGLSYVAGNFRGVVWLYYFSADVMIFILIRSMYMRLLELLHRKMQHMPVVAYCALYAYEKNGLDLIDLYKM